MFNTFVAGKPCASFNFMLRAFMFTFTHRAMFKLGGKKLFVLCLLVKNVSAANSADRCNFKESEKVAQDLNRIGGDISSD